MRRSVCLSLLLLFLTPVFASSQQDNSSNVSRVWQSEVEKDVEGVIGHWSFDIGHWSFVSCYWLLVHCLVKLRLTSVK